MKTHRIKSKLSKVERLERELQKALFELSVEVEKTFGEGWYSKIVDGDGDEEIATSYIADNIAGYYGGVNMNTKMVNYRLRKVEKLGIIEMFSDRCTMTTLKLLNRNLEVL